MVKVAFVASCAVLPNSAYAAPPRETAANFISFLAVEDYSSLETRNRLVGSLRSYCIDLDQAFPHNAPSDDAWLMDELSAGDKRGTAAAQSPIFARRVVRTFLTDCLAASEQYFQGDAQAFALFGLIHAFEIMVSNASRWGRQNGLDPNEWGLGYLNNVPRMLAAAGIANEMQRLSNEQK